MSFSGKDEDTDAKPSFVQVIEDKDINSFEKNFNKFRDYDLLVCLLAILGLLVTIVDHQFTFNHASVYVSKNYPELTGPERAKE